MGELAVLRAEQGDELGWAQAEDGPDIRHSLVTFG